MKCTSLRLLKPRQPYRIVQVRGDDQVTILHMKEACNEVHVPDVSGFNPEVSRGSSGQQWQGSRFEIKILQLYRCRHSYYQDLEQTICTISRVRETNRLHETPIFVHNKT